MRTSFATGLMLMLLVLTPQAQAATSLDQTIAFLLQKIESTDATFIRNGKNYTSKQGVEHVRAKYEHFKKEIKTPEDFIRLSATQSLVSGKPYRVRFADGHEMRVADWLKDELQKYRAANP